MWRMTREYLGRDAFEASRVYRSLRSQDCGTCLTLSVGGDRTSSFRYEAPTPWLGYSISHNDGETGLERRTNPWLALSENPDRRLLLF